MSDRQATAEQPGIPPPVRSAFPRLFLAQAVSLLGDRLTPVVLAFAVLDLTGSVADLGVVVGAQFLPVVVLTLLGGAIGDRMSRRRLVVVTHLIRFVGQALVAAGLITHTVAVWQLVLLQLVNGSAAAVFQPVFWGLVPEVVAEPGRRRANAALNLVDSLASIVGPALGGLLLAVASPGWGIGIDALSFLAAAALVGTLPTAPRAADDRPVVPVLRLVRQGWDHVRHRGWLTYTIFAASLFQLVVLAPLSVLGPEVAATSLGGSAAWAKLSAALGVGAAAGAALCLRWHPRRPLGTAFAFALLTGPVLALLAGPAPLWLLLVAEFAAGMAMALFDTWWLTLVQQRVPAELLSRVLSIDLLGSVALRPVGLFVIGPLAGVVGVRRLLLIAFGINVVVLAAGVAQPRIWRLRDRTGTPAP